MAGGSSHPWPSPRSAPTVRPWSCSAGVCPSSRRGGSCWPSSETWTAPSSSVSDRAGASFLSPRSSSARTAFLRCFSPSFTRFYNRPDYLFCSGPGEGPRRSQTSPFWRCSQPVRVTRAFGKDSPSVRKGRGTQRDLWEIGRVDLSQSGREALDAEERACSIRDKVEARDGPV